MADRTPLILVPGLLCTERLWAHQVEALSDIADPVVVDHRHHASLTELASSILANSPERFALAGLSMGGYTAMEIIRQAPERVERVAFLDTSYLADKPEQSAGRRDVVELARREGVVTVHEILIKSWVPDYRLSDESFMADARQMAEDTGVDGFANQQNVIMSRPDSTETLKEIDCPALVLCGKQDMLTPVELHEEMAHIIPDAELAVIEDCGHLSTMERPEAVTKNLIQWINK